MIGLRKPPDECRSGVLNYKRQLVRRALADARRDRFAAGLRIQHLERLMEHARHDQQHQVNLIVFNQQQLKVTQRAIDEFQESLSPQCDDDDDWGVPDDDVWPGVPDDA